MPKIATAKNFLFSSLASIEVSQPFDGVAAGEFTDMYGRPTVIRREDLAVYVSNTQRNILATTDASGNVVGLPIDCINHNHGEAAGWVTDVQLAAGRDVILFTARWNELGKSLIGSDSVRMFSPELNLREKVIMGGSLTNWPATRTRAEQILLRPIALSSALSSISVDESMEERLCHIRTAFHDSTGNNWYVYAVEVFDGYLICRDEDEDKLYKVGFTEGEDGPVFEDRLSWVEVKQTYIEAAMQMVRDIFTRVFSGAGQQRDVVPTQPAPGSDSTFTEDRSMTDVTKLTPEERKALLAQLTSGSDLPSELAAVVDQQVNLRVAALLAVEQRKMNTSALVSRLVGGTAEAPRGLPVDKTELADFVLSLSPEQAEKATAFLAKIQEKGLIDFSEDGHGREVVAQQILPAEYATALDTGKLSIDDLANPILGLGDLGQYNLSKWQGKGK